MRVPTNDWLTKIQAFRHSLTHRWSIRVQCGQSSDGATELHLQQSRAQFLEALFMARQRHQPSGDFVAECNWHSVLHLATPDHQCVAVLISNAGDVSDDPIERFFGQCNDVFQGEYQTGVHDVLSRGTPMRELTQSVRHQFCQLTDQPDDRKANRCKVLAIAFAINVLNRRACRDRLCCTLRNDAQSCFSFGECDLNLKVA